MQSVVRFSLVGIFAMASLTACGDKLTVTETPPDSTVRSVTVTPGSVTLNVGQKTTLVASVQAGPGVTNLGVTWSSSNTAIATVTATGEVTAVSAGVTTVVAASAAKPDVKGAAGVTVNAVGVPTVSISSTNTTVCSPPPAQGGTGQCSSVPANLQNFGTASPTGGTGQLDVVANVEPNGVALKSVQGTLTCGGKSITASQNLSAEAAIESAEENAAPVTLSFNTTELDAAGVPKVFNTGPFNLGSATTVPPCTLAVSLTPVTGTAPPASTTSVQLNNADVATLLSTTANGATANDQNGSVWKSGDLKVSAIPALYSQRGVTSIIVTVAGATPENVTAAAGTGGAFDAIWTNSTSGNRVNDRTLSGGVTNGIAVPVVPTVRLIDAKGNDAGALPRPQTNTAAQFNILLDNQAPQPAQTFQVVQTQGQWVNGTYVFFANGASGTAPSAANRKFVSCGDAPNTPGIPAAAAAQPDCIAQGGVSAAPPTLFSLTDGVNGGANPNATLRVFSFDTQGASAPSALSNGTSNSATTCNAVLTASNGWVEITTNANALQEGPANTRYVVRALESDKLGNVRCTDLTSIDNTINTPGFARAPIGVDKTAPTVPNGRLQNSDENILAANDHAVYGVASTLQSFIFAA